MAKSLPLQPRARDGFDYNYGGFPNNYEGFRSTCEVISFLRGAGIESRIKDSGKLFRIWMPDHEAYYWPGDDTDESWTLEFDPK